ncbi:hypothetical protein, partial [Rhodococcus sp. IEGM 1307]|uniref:hypothetical protein n=1 Tax=Rhodococcus sp. IEGM 1307 TaxID=3047091 RepID=UPI0024B6CDC6
LPQPQITLNYLGRFDHPPSGPEAGWMPVTDVDLGRRPDSDLAAAAVLTIDVATVVTEGAARLTATWSYAAGVLAATDVDDIAELWTEALTALADHISRPG